LDKTVVAFKQSKEFESKSTSRAVFGGVATIRYPDAIQMIGSRFEKL
jgi:hypothetical protein